MTIRAPDRLTYTEGTYAVDIELEDYPKTTSSSVVATEPSDKTWLKKRCFRKLFSDVVEAANSPPLKERKIDLNRAPSVKLNGDLAISPVAYLSPSQALSSLQLKATPLQSTNEVGRNASPVSLGAEPLEVGAFIPLKKSE